MSEEDGLVAEAREVLEIAEVEQVLAREAAEGTPFTSAELAYARSKSDPVRRLAARLAAKRAAVRLLGAGVSPAEVEVLRGHGAPRIELSAGAAARLRGLGATRILVSLTHGRTHAAASVVLVRGSA